MYNMPLLYLCQPPFSQIDIFMLYNTFTPYQTTFHTPFLHAVHGVPRLPPFCDVLLTLQCQKMSISPPRERYIS
jgi:hypothetical protein